jgi:hypothetical protein
MASLDKSVRANKARNQRKWAHLTHSPFFLFLNTSPYSSRFFLESLNIFKEEMGEEKEPVWRRNSWI